MDRLELRVGDRGLRHDGQVVARHEGDEVVDRGGDALVVGRDVHRAARRAGARADPHELLAEAAGVLLPARLGAEEAAVHLADRGGVEVVGEAQRGDLRGDGALVGSRRRRHGASGGHAVAVGDPVVGLAADRGPLERVVN